jgi:hypothetical protein
MLINEVNIISFLLEKLYGKNKICIFATLYKFRLPKKSHCIKYTYLNYLDVPKFIYKTQPRH